jgi:hypothetical protein
MVRRRTSNSAPRDATGEKKIEVVRLRLWKELGGWKSLRNLWFEGGLLLMNV